MKLSIGLTLAVIVLAGGFTYNEMQHSNLLTQQIDPDYQQIETRIRQQLTREMQATTC